MFDNMFNIFRFKLKKINKQKQEDVDILTRNKMAITELFAPDGVQEGFSDIRLGQNFSRVYVIHGVPRKVRVGWLDEILDVGDVDMSVHIVPPNDNEVLRSLLSKITRARSQEYIDRQNGNISRLPELAAQIADYEALYSAVQLGEDRIFFMTFVFAVHALSEKELMDRCTKIETIFARQGVKPVIMMLQQLEGLKSVLPLAFANLGEEFAKNFTSGAAACCLPLTAVAGGHSSGVLIGYNLYTRTPVFLDRFAGERVVSNPHMFISGETGSGKSVTLRQIALLETYKGVRFVFIDPEGEYVDFVSNLGGTIINLRPGEFSGLNPLDVEPEADEQGRVRVNIQEKMEDLIGLVGTVYEFYNRRGLDVVEASLLEDALRQEYIERGITSDPDSLYENGIKKPMPTLSDVQKRLAKTDNGRTLADAMKPLLAGGTVGMFDGQTTVHLTDARHICFNLKPLGGDFSRFIGIFAVLAWLWPNFAVQGGKAVPKSIAVDEAWMFLRHPAAAKYLETLARRGRKHGCGLMIATQRFEEFARSEEGRAIIESCATVLTLRQEEHASDAATEYFKLASGCSKLLSECKPGQGILRVSNSTVAVQISPAPFEWPLVETKVSGS